MDTLFAYPGGASMEIHQALTRSDQLRNILCRHEQVGALVGKGAGLGLVDLLVTRSRVKRWRILPLALDLPC